jgi:hypothetical protein
VRAMAGLAVWGAGAMTLDAVRFAGEVHLSAMG